MAFAPAAAMAVIGLGGQALSAYGQYEEGQQTKRAYDYNARIDEQQAELTRRQMDFIRRKTERDIKSLAGEQTAGYAKAGVTMEGSPLEVMTQSMQDAEYDLAIEQYNHEVAARSAESAAGIKRYYGRQARRASNVRAVSTLLKAGASAASLL